MNSSRKIKILIVDDHSATRELVRAVLRGNDSYEIISAEDGHSALIMLSKERFDIIVCDWNMPNVTGLEVLKQVRDNPSTRYTPFIMLTAEAYRESVAAALEAGVTDYVAKPFTASILLAKIEKALSNR